MSMCIIIYRVTVIMLTDTEIRADRVADEYLPHFGWT